MAKILLLHGPNLNLLGQREPEQYGNVTLATINAQMASLAKELGHNLDTVQSNSETVLIDRIQQCVADATDFIIINPAAFTHTSIALRDALLTTAKPTVEVHLSNIYRREEFRQKSYFSDIAIGVIMGFGAQSYLLALRYADHYLRSNKTP